VSLGTELGVIEETIRVALQKLVTLGFLRREKQYRYDEGRHRSVRTTDKYFVLMEEPIAPEDEPRAFVLAAERILADAKTDRENRGEAPKANNPPYEKRAVDNQAPKAKNPPQYAGGHPARKSYLGEVLKNVNVATRTKEQLLRTADLAQQILEQLGDRHSMGFYRRVAQRVPSEVVYRALSETKEARHGGEVVNAAAYFTARVKQLAAERGIQL